MKKIIIGSIVWAVALLTSSLVQAQGTMTYVSNLGQTSTGSAAVGSDSWLAADFITGNNAAGYSLNSVQLALTDASGNPSGFTAMIYDGNGNSPGGIAPGSSLGTLTGSLNPASTGTYAYTPVSSLTLSPNSYYFVVLTSGTTVANGAYEWSVTSTPSPGFTSFHWGGEIFFAHSSNGLNWNLTSGTYGQFSITATAIPEPSTLGLLGLGGLGLLWHRRKAKAV